MPSSIAAAVPTTVLPKVLCTSFTETHAYPMLCVTYHDGTSERGLVTDGVNAAKRLRAWSLRPRQSATALSTLRTFFIASQGKPFYFYDPYQTSGAAIGSNWDGTGSSTQGRHVCIFTSQEWNENVTIGNSDTSFEMREVA